MILASGTFPALRRAAWFITGRHGGFSSPPFESLNLADHVGDENAAVTRNREAIRTYVGANEIVWMNAEHGNRVLEVPTSGGDSQSDILVTRIAGIGIAALAGDCVPLALCSERGIIAVAHVGWRGLMAGTVHRAVEALSTSKAQTLDVVVGPGICGTCYLVPAERVQVISQTLEPGVAEAAWVDDTHVDIQRAIFAQLAIYPQVTLISGVSTCTVEDEHLFSYRRDHRTGRHAMIAVMQHE